MNLTDRLQAVRNRLIDRGEYDQHGADVVDATTIAEAILEIARLESLVEHAACQLARPGSFLGAP